MIPERYWPPIRAVILVGWAVLAYVWYGFWEAVALMAVLIALLVVWTLVARVWKRSRWYDAGRRERWLGRW
jgi:uncharacterized membrane protein (DUF373 family)